MKKSSTICGSTMISKDKENAADAFNKEKKLGVVEPTKRAALGNLHNRSILLRPTVAKDAATKALKATSKASRVDSHWKKHQPLSSSTTITTNTTAIAATAQQKHGDGIKTTATTSAATAAVAQRKVLTRAASVRLSATAKATTNNAAEGTAAGTQPQKSKTLTTNKVIENKAAQPVKRVVKPKVKEEKPITLPPLRREDSNLSRKSLTKLKAALARDGGGLVTTKVAAVITKTEPVNQASVAPKAAVAPTDIKLVSVQTHSQQLLSAVEDIDAGDGDNLVLVSQYANDIYDYLFSLEEVHAIRPNHLEGHKEIYPKMRAILNDWINEVHTQFHCVAETFQMAIAIIDRYLQLVLDTKRSHLQLVGVTALFIAAKYEELFPPAINDFVYITDETYTAEQILQMEIKIMKAIDFNLSRPVPLHFLRRFSKAANAEDSHHAMAKYFIELTLIEYELAHFKPSEIAAASIFLALHLVDGNSDKATGFDDTHWTPTLQWYSRYSPEHLYSITRKIATIARNAPHSKLKSVYTKYQSNALLRISQRPELYSPLMDSIIKSSDEEQQQQQQQKSSDAKK